MRGSDSLDADIRKRFAKLEAYCPDIVSGRVLVSPAERHHRSGNRIHVRIEVSIAGEDIVVDRDASPRTALRTTEAPRVRKQDELETEHRHAKVAVREAFEAARRRLQDRTAIRRGRVKTHERTRPGTARS